MADGRTHPSYKREEDPLCDSLLSGWDWLIFYTCSKTTVRKQAKIANSASHTSIFLTALFSPLKNVLFAKIAPLADQPHLVLRLLAKLLPDECELCNLRHTPTVLLTAWVGWPDKCLEKGLATDKCNNPDNCRSWLTQRIIENTKCIWVPEKWI